MKHSETIEACALTPLRVRDEMAAYLDESLDDTQWDEAVNEYWGEQLRNLVRTGGSVTESAWALDVSCAGYLVGATDWGCVTG